MVKGQGSPLFNQVTLVGLGLIGGSLGLVLRKGRVARKVIGFSRHESTLRRAKARGVIDDGDTELCPEWLGQSDLVVIATPPLAVIPTAQKIAKITTGRLLLTDVASTKAEIVRTLDDSLPSRISFVGGHPMTGSEESGIDAANAKLFQGALCLLTPTARTNRKAAARVVSLWRGVGCRIHKLSPGAHDARVAEISHLPHLAAVGLTLTPDAASLKLAGPGFVDTTRIAAGNPALWEEIFRTNTPSMLKVLARYGDRMEGLRRLIRTKRWTELRRRLGDAQRRCRQL